jgi:ABC-2 type transport system ATP-binding protein
MHDDNVISCREVTKQYPAQLSVRAILSLRFRRMQKCVLDGVTFAVAPGEIFGIVGPNGAGKTTILKILSHLTTPTRGSASICGYDIEKQWNRAVRCIGYCISEERSFFWRLTGRQNLMFFADLLEVPGRIARERIGELFEMLELAEAADERFMNYSSGMKQKMAIARSLLADPQVLLMDEPTRGLDPRAASRLRSFIGEYISTNDRAAIVTTNQIADIEHLCKRIAILDHGDIIARGTVPEITSLAREIVRTEQDVSFEQAFTIILERHEKALGTDPGE